MPDFPEAAILAAARILGNDCHGGPPDDNDMRLAGDVLSEAWPHLAEAVAAAILAHRDSCGPPAGVPGDGALRRTWRRHFTIAAQVAGLALFTEDELKRMAADALNRGDYIACRIPEVPDERT